MRSDAQIEIRAEVKEKMVPVLLVWAPKGTDREQREALRVELEDGIRRRLLVLDRSVSICVMELPLPKYEVEDLIVPGSLTGEKAKPESQKEGEKRHTGKVPPTVKVRHDPRTAEEKTEIMARLVRFREERGLGCFKKLSTACGKGVSEDMIRILYTGESPCPIDIWRKVGKGLEKLGFQKMGGGKPEAMEDDSD